jgi:hypothetical protein
MAGEGIGQYIKATRYKSDLLAFKDDMKILTKRKEEMAKDMKFSVVNGI